MPTLNKAIEAQVKSPLRGRRVGVCLHVTKETSVLVMGLKSLGAEVYLAAANPLSTQDDIAAFLASEGISVYAWRGETAGEYFDCIQRVLKSEPHIIMDDGADTHATLHGQKSAVKAPVGGTEETTTGVVRLKALEKTGKLRYPIIAVNNAYTKHLFDNRYGTGQSTFDGILRATSLLLAGKHVVVAGYGWVGRGIAGKARGLGSVVTVCEVDPVKALEARLDGFEVAPMIEAASEGDLFITATGQTGVIRLEHMKKLKDGAILANAGHFDVEVDVKSLASNSRSVREVRPHVEEYNTNWGRKVYLIGKGRIANLVAAEGHPPEVMALSFSNQLLSSIYLVKNEGQLSRKLLDVPQEIDMQVARYALEAMSVNLDTPTKEQLKYAANWAL
jgi:adenosylhomocysteinase